MINIWFYKRFMFIYIFLIIAIIIIVFLLFYICRFLEKREKAYRNYLYNNSVSLKILQEINAKYRFYTCGSYNEEHIYDNIFYYNNICCQDYLIYQLQFKKNNILRDIRNVANNKKNYSLYCKDVLQAEQFGNYTETTKGYKEKRLLSLEKKLFEQNRLYPQIDFTIQITLYCSKMNGYIYHKKIRVFNSEQILSLIYRLDDKNGAYFIDRGIWDALCRVERGKVTNKMRFSIYERDGYRCKICGRSGRDVDLEIDHIKPISKGGKSTYDNLQTLCKYCNQDKGDRW